MSCNDNALRLSEGVQGEQGPQGIQGEQGIQGPQGQTGLTGDAGAQGIQGIQGETGLTGSTGPKGNTGAQGAPGQQGSPGQQGIQGIQGIQGVQGIQGATGQAFLPDEVGVFNEAKVTSIQSTSGASPTNSFLYLVTTDSRVDKTTPVNYLAGTAVIGHLIGFDGTTGTTIWTDYGAITGAAGATGATGSTGVQGIPGSTGATGATGTTGTNGIDGATWRDGVGAPASGLGSNNDYYLNRTTGDVYKKTSGAYAIVANIKGVTGTTGATGSQGLPGPPGPAGASNGSSNFVEDYGAIGNGSSNFISTVINPLTGVVYGSAAAGLAAAQLRWNLVVEQWSVDIVTITASAAQNYIITSTPSGARTYTSPGAETTTDIAAAMSQAFNGSNYNSHDSYCAMHNSRSQTSLAIGTGTKTLIVNNGMCFKTDQIIRIKYDTSNYMDGTVVSFDEPTRTLVASIASVAGSGTYTQWTLETNSVAVFTKSANAITVATNMSTVRLKTYGTSRITSTTTDTVDWAAIQQGLHKGSGGVGYGTLNFGNGSEYVINKPLELPVSTTRAYRNFILNGNSSTIRATGSFITMGRFIPHMTFANSVGGNMNKTVIQNLQFRGPGGAKNIQEGNQSVGLYLPGYYNALVTGCRFEGFDLGIDLQWSLNCVVEKCAFNGMKDWSIRARTANWEGTESGTLAQSNGILISKNQFRLFQGTVLGMEGATGGVAIEGGYECELLGNQFEGPSSAGTAPKCAVFFDQGIASLNKNFKIDTMHIERSFSSYPIIVQGGANCQVHLKNINALASLTSFIKATNYYDIDSFHRSTSTYGGTMTIELDMFASMDNLTSAAWIRSEGTALSWRMNKVRGNTITKSGSAVSGSNGWLDPARADGSTIWETSSVTTNFFGHTVASRTATIPTTTMFMGTQRQGTVTIGTITNPAANATTALTADILAIKTALTDINTQLANVKLDIASILNLR